MATLEGDVRSAAGHAAFSMKGSDDRWVQIQLSTFANWVNEQLRNMDMSVQDIRTDFADGIKLCSLIQVLQGKSIGRVIKKPLNQHHYLENVSLALKAITQDNIKLVNIGESDSLFVACIVLMFKCGFHRLNTVLDADQRPLHAECLATTALIAFLYYSTHPLFYSIINPD